VGECRMRYVSLIATNAYTRLPYSVKDIIEK